MKKWILLVIALQVLALLSIAAKREWIYRYGETVYLRTAPVDPRDLFRGDYVQLQYDIAYPNATEISAGLTEELEVDGQAYRQIYVTLVKDANGVARIKTILPNEPDDTIFIKGQIGKHLWRGWQQNGTIKYGIEKYFIEQGSGAAMEERRGRAQEWQTAMEVEVALGGDGTAVIKGHRWSDLGVKLEVLETATRQNDTDTDGSPQRLNPKVVMRLRNQSTHTIGIIDTASHCGFKLIQNQGSQIGLVAATSALTFPDRNCDAEPQIVHTLAPEEVYSVTLDFEDPRWFIEHDNKSLPLVEIPAGWAGFRLEYQPPQVSEPGQLAELEIWNSNIRSARFVATGRVD